MTSNRNTTDRKPHVAILGAGPTGLEAALAAAEHGYPFTVFEAEPGVAGQLRRWGHVRLFTPWSLSLSPRMRRALEAAGRTPPAADDLCPTGEELVSEVFQPLAELPRLRGRLRCGVEVRRVGRRGLLKHEEIGTPERGRRPFRLLVRDADGRERLEGAGVVLDCTGTTEPNPLGDGGIPAPGEESLDGVLQHEIPDLRSTAEAWSGSRVLVVGAGHSAQTAVRDLVELAPGTEVVWALRDEEPDLGAVEEDPLPERARLTATAAALIAEPPPGLEVRRGVVVDAVERRGDRVAVTLRRRDGAVEEVTVDRILALTGKVGDHLLYRQLQVHECYATSGPMKLAAALLAGSGAGGGDCLQQASQGAETLVNPEPGFFILGAKSYGRRNDFLMRVGWQQVDEVFGLLDR
jgi:hypothetical protein